MAGMSEETASIDETCIIACLTLRILHEKGSEVRSFSIRDT